ncbi:MAG: (Fe-S)-binding protein [Desulfobacteraceae bacterium]|nr:(Fe-S)-binding protein [Desulfobacteraceae bacterium]
MMVNIKQIREILDVYDSARIQTWLNICSKCGLCAESCFVYLGHDKDPKMSPAYKVKRTLGEMYRQKGNVTREFLEGCFDTLWLHCTLCKRCSLYCPFGIDIATMMSLARRVCNSQGVLPEKLAFFTDNCRKSGNHMALPIEEFQETCEWMADEAGEEIKGVEIPFDKPDVKYMYTINPREPVFYPQDIAMAAKIFTIVGESWTMPSYGWDCTNLPCLQVIMRSQGRWSKACMTKPSNSGRKNYDHRMRSCVSLGEIRRTLFCRLSRWKASGGNCALCAMDI